MSQADSPSANGLLLFVSNQKEVPVGFFANLFGKSSSPFDAQAEAVKLLAVLPPCSQNVVVASPRYSGNYRCEVSVPANRLTVFVRRLSESTFGGSQESQVVRAAMPLWLERASLDGKTSYMPQDFFENINAYVLNFIKDGNAEIYCNDCGTVIRDLKEQTRNESRSGPQSEWTSSWRCPSGHLLYTEDHEVRFIYARREP